MIVTWPLAFVVVPAVIVPVMLPPLSVTVAPGMGLPAQVTVTATEPTGIVTVTFVVEPPVTLMPLCVPVWPPFSDRDRVAATWPGR